MKLHCSYARYSLSHTGCVDDVVEVLRRRDRQQRTSRLEGGEEWT